MTPGYPLNPGSLIMDDALRRPVHEVDFSSGVNLGGLQAVDWFCDGSFYLLDLPGHAIGHMGALARTSTGPNGGGEDTYILMGSDACVHAGQLRPSIYTPLPEHVPLFQDKRKTEPFFRVANRPGTQDVHAATNTIDKLQLLDSQPNVFTVMAHDRHLLDVIDLFPEKANDWRQRGWKERTRWLFLKDLGRGHLLN